MFVDGLNVRREGKRDNEGVEIVSDTLTNKSNILSERQKAVIGTIRMRLTEEQSLVYLNGVGFECSHATFYREKKIVQDMKLKRLFHIAQIGLQDQHLERIDNFEMGLKMMWQNVFRKGSIQGKFYDKRYPNVTTIFE